MRVLALLISALLLPAPPAFFIVRVRQLDHANWRAREHAECELRRHMTWTRALWLERRPPASAESKRRTERVLRSYWYGWVPPAEVLPYVDALNQERHCSPPDTPLVTHYLAAAPMGVSLGGVSYPRYRLATALLVDDLIRARVPPEAIRNLLSMMDRRSREWDRRNGH